MLFSFYPTVRMRCARVKSGVPIILNFVVVVTNSQNIDAELQFAHLDRRTNDREWFTSNGRLHYAWKVNGWMQGLS